MIKSEKQNLTFPERWVKEVYRPDQKPWHNKIHVIKGLSYRQATSWSGFFSYKHTRNHVDGYDHFFKDFGQDELEMNKATQASMNKRGIDVEYTYEWIYHEDLYDFYDYIGYNRHTKKFERS